MEVSETMIHDQTFFDRFRPDAKGSSFVTVQVNNGGDDQSNPGVEVCRGIALLLLILSRYTQGKPRYSIYHGHDVSNLEYLLQVRSSFTTSIYHCSVDAIVIFCQQYRRVTSLYT